VETSKATPEVVEAPKAAKPPIEKEEEEWMPIDIEVINAGVIPSPPKIIK